jgi:chromosome segregation ATPase
MSNLTARRAYNVTLEAKVKDLAEQKGAAVVSARGAEERFKQLMQQKEELADERQQLSEQLAVLQAERKGEADLAAQGARVYESRITALEASLADERAAMVPRMDAAEEQVRALQRERETLLDDRARLQQQVSSLTAEKRGLEELTKRLEAQLPPLREEKAAVVASLEASEERSAELSRLREQAAVEKARLVEELAVVRAEKRGAEELAKREQGALDDSLQAALLRIEPVEERAKDAQRAKDALQEERQHLAEQVAVLQVERRRSDDLCRRSEGQASQALEDKLASTARADAADERTREAVSAKELAVAERARAEEALSVAVAERKRVEEIARLAETKLKDELAALQAHASFAE